MNISQKTMPQINLIKIPPNNPIPFHLDSQVEWVKDFLIEMNEHASEKSREEYLLETSLLISGEMEKKNKADLGEVLLVKGNLQATYATECVRTLTPMKMKMAFSFKVIFIDSSFEESELFKDIDETYVENDIYEIYFSHKRIADLKEMLHEQIFLHYDQYPVLDAESRLEGMDDDPGNS